VNRRWRGAAGMGRRAVIWMGCGLLALGSCKGDGGAHPAAPVAPAPPPTPPEPPAPPPPPPPEPPAPPPPATNVVVEAADASATLRWGAPSDRDGITAFGVRVVPLAAAPARDWIRVPNTARHYTFPGLTNGVSYLFEIRSVDDRGTPADPADDLYSPPVSVSATPLESEPPPPARTWIGFADRHVTLIEGGHVRLPLPFAGEPVALDAVPGFPVDVESDAPDGQLRWTYITANDEGNGYHSLGLHAVPDGVDETPSSFEITLRRREPGIGISRGAGVLRVNVRDAADPECATLDLTSSESRLGDDAVQTGEFLFEGPEGAALRIGGPYATFLDAYPDDPPHPVISPLRLLYRELARRGHRQQFSLHWSGELSLAAVAPGCAPVLLNCGAGGCDR